MTKITRILIVDDNHSFRKGMHAFLSIQPNLEVIGEAPNGHLAIEIITKLQPELVLLDVQMPGMNGIELTRYIKDYWPKTKVIILTMYPEYCSKALEAGADSFITKGIPVEQILSSIRETINS